MNTRGLNLDLQKKQFTVLVFVKVGDVGTVLASLQKEATHVEVVYINTLPGKVPPGRPYTLDCFAFSNIKKKKKNQTTKTKQEHTHTHTKKTPKF